MRGCLGESGMWIVFAGNRRQHEVMRKQRDAARLGQLDKTRECLAAGESRVLVVGADKMPAGLIGNGFRNLSGGHAGLSEAIDGFHVPYRNTPIR